jgi:hypothetical protein
VAKADGAPGVGAGFWAGFCAGDAWASALAATAAPSKLIELKARKSLRDGGMFVLERPEKEETRRSLIKIAYTGTTCSRSVPSNRLLIRIENALPS